MQFASRFDLTGRRHVTKVTRNLFQLSIAVGTVFVNSVFEFVDHALEIVLGVPDISDHPIVLFDIFAVFLEAYVDI